MVLTGKMTAANRHFFLKVRIISALKPKVAICGSNVEHSVKFPFFHPFAKTAKKNPKIVSSFRAK